MTPAKQDANLDTLPKLLREKALRLGDRQMAMRVKDRGIWQQYTWKDYHEKVRDLCLGMISLGLEPEDKICIIGENKPEWFWAELAAQCAGAVAVGILVTVPFLGQASASLIGSRTYGQSMTELYSADAGVEHAIWQLKYDGLADSLTAENPTANDSITINNMTGDITITRVEETFPPEPAPPPGPEGPQAWRVQISKSVEPESAPVGQPTIFTFTIYIENVSTSEIHVEEFRDLLPVEFMYTEMVSGLITYAELTQNLVDGQWELVWDFSPPYDVIGAGEIETQVFQATATLSEEDIYWNTAWVTGVPSSIGTVGTGSTAPVGGGEASAYAYDIVSSAEGTTIRARASLTDTGVNILSWEPE